MLARVIPQSPDEGYRVLVRCREGMAMVNHTWYYRHMWVTWRSGLSAEEAAADASRLALGGSRVRVFTEEEYMQLPGHWFRALPSIA